MSVSTSNSHINTPIPSHQSQEYGVDGSLRQAHEGRLKQAMDYKEDDEGVKARNSCPQSPAGDAERCKITPQELREELDALKARMKYEKNLCRFIKDRVEREWRLLNKSCQDRVAQLEGMLGRCELKEKEVGWT